MMPTPRTPGPTIAEPRSGDDGSAPEAILVAALEQACLAPSLLNTQPWWFRRRGVVVEVHADRARGLRAIDPDGRELTMSCGAAIFHLRVGIRHFGRASELKLLPNAGDPDHLADVGVGAPKAPTPEMQMLFAAIPRRRTNRSFFPDRAIPAAVVDAIRFAARLEGAKLLALSDERVRGAVIDLVEQGDTILFNDECYCRDLAAWLRPGKGSNDGIAASAVPIGSVASRATSGRCASFDVAHWQARRDRLLAETAPTLVVLVTHGDTPRDWLTAGQALDRVLLRAAVDGVSASFLHQPFQAPDLRLKLREAVGTMGCVQALLRVGYGPEVARTPRRLLHELIR